MSTAAPTERECPTRSRTAPVPRRRLWEIIPGWHCSIIGTCLTVGELRVLARRLGHSVPDTQRTDMLLHSFFVTEARTASRPARMFTKLLNRKHEAAIRRFRGLGSPAELMAAWREAFDTGDIPGPYWAAMSHPQLEEELGVAIYGDVHMLSHLVGASNCADVAALHRMQQGAAAREERAHREARRQRERLEAKQRVIDDLQREVGMLRGQLQQSAGPDRGRPVEEAELDDHRRELSRIRALLAAEAAETDRLRQENRELSARIPALHAEVSALELALADDAADPVAEGPGLDLGGRSILYVGGRIPQVGRLRELVRRWNGRLLHHDGGLERSLDELAGAVHRADAVLFPTDCVSHSAVIHVKRLCQQLMKPYVPLRTSGVASFVAGVRDAVADGFEGAASEFKSNAMQFTES